MVGYSRLTPNKNTCCDGITEDIITNLSRIRRLYRTGRHFQIGSKVVTEPLETEGARASRVVIVGAGFGGLAAARALARSSAKVTVIDCRNHHLFQPLLYQVATAGLSPADIAAPIRAILRDQANATVILGTVTAVDRDVREVVFGGRRIPYDYLVLATGVRHDYFGRDWERHAPGLKTVEDATAIRARVLLAFERAETARDPEERRGFLTFVIVGGGPTGVELAGALAELAKRALARDFRAIDPREARIALLEGGPRLLPTFPATLSAYAERALRRLGVEVRTHAKVDHIDQANVMIAGERIASRTVLWAAGVRASPVAEWLGVEADQHGRVKVAPDLSVPGLAGVFVIGDAALAADVKGGPYPGVAPVAVQQGTYVGRRIDALISGRPAGDPFRYRDRGNWATIGRSAAVIDFGRFRMKGLLAWLLWGTAHIFFLIGFRNKAAVMLEWLWSYATFKRGMRLITGPLD